MFRTFGVAGLGLALMAAVGAFALATPGGQEVTALTNCTTTSEAVTANEQAVIDAVNVYRQQNGLGTVKLSPNLSRAASYIAEDLDTKGYWNQYFTGQIPPHYEPNGRSPFQRALDCGYATSNIAENLAVGFSGSSVVAAWKTSPGHNAVMLLAGARVAGIGSSGGYWALEMGAVDDSGSTPGTPTTTTATATATPTKTPTPTPGPNDPSAFPIRRALLQMIASE